MAATLSTLVGAKCRSGDFNVVHPGEVLSTVAGNAAIHVQTNRGHVVDVFEYVGTTPTLTVPVAKLVDG